MGGAFGGVDLEIATAEDLGAREKGGGRGGRRRAEAGGGAEEWKEEGKWGGGEG